MWSFSGVWGKTEKRAAPRLNHLQYSLEWSMYTAFFCRTIVRNVLDAEPSNGQLCDDDDDDGGGGGALDN